MTGGSGAIAWLVIAIGLFVLESMTTQLVCIWFGIGALVTMIAAFFGIVLPVQLVVFLIVSVAVLLAIRPAAKKKLLMEKHPTNADMVIDMTGIITETVNNIEETGRVTVNGLSWATRAACDDDIIEIGDKIRVMRIEGVKLIVEPLSQKKGVGV